MRSGAGRQSLTIASSRGTGATTLLDSTVLIDSLRGVEHVRTRLLAFLEVVSVGKAEAVLAARWRREFAHEGTTLHLADCLIAASAVTHGVSLATATAQDFSEARAGR